MSSPLEALFYDTECQCLWCTEGVSFAMGDDHYLANRLMPWVHAYVADADGACNTCGLIGSLIHTAPEARGNA